VRCPFSRRLGCDERDPYHFEMTPTKMPATGDSRSGLMNRNYSAEAPLSLAANRACLPSVVRFSQRPDRSGRGCDPRT
jgi:hypothetical protein